MAQQESTINPNNPPTIIGSVAELKPGMDLYDTTFERYVVVERIYESSVAVIYQGQRYAALISQFERLQADVIAARRARRAGA